MVTCRFKCALQEVVETGPSISNLILSIMNSFLLDATSLSNLNKNAKPRENSTFPFTPIEANNFPLEATVAELISIPAILTALERMRRVTRNTGT